jgi:3,4-dihydroxy 2-butanone 4-phosphate synthase
MFNEPPQVQTASGSSLDIAINQAIKSFRLGKPLLVHDFDDREGETDIIYPALAVSSEDVARLRRDAGGLICVAVSHEVAEAFDLPFLADELSHPSSRQVELGYDERSSFSLPVNHVNTFTGITDIDRALTITKLGGAAVEPQTLDFDAEFDAPGHVPVLRAAPNLLADREGHTELGIELANAAGRAPAVVVCEMLDHETGRATSKKDARRYARRNNLHFLDGPTIKRSLMARPP